MAKSNKPVIPESKNISTEDRVNNVDPLNYENVNWRCLDRIHGYCTGIPNFDVEPNCFDKKTYLGGTCKNKWNTCDNFSASNPVATIINENSD